MSVVSMKQLLRRCPLRSNTSLNPKMERYIYTERNGIYIIDLQQTVN